MGRRDAHLRPHWRSVKVWVSLACGFASDLRRTVPGSAVTDCSCGAWAAEVTLRDGMGSLAVAMGLGRGRAGCGLRAVCVRRRAG